MATTYMNDGNPLPPGHPHAGKVGIIIDPEDGMPPQRVYADNKEEMLLKVGKMYSSTKTRLTEVKAEAERLRKPPTSATPPAAPAKDPQAAAEKRLQLTSEISDPARSGKAIIELIKDEGIDLEEDKRQKEQEDLSARELERLQRCTTEFARNNPDYNPGPWGRLISDRAFSKYGEITTETLQRSFEDLCDGGMLPSAALEQEQTPGNEDDLSDHRPSAEPTPPPRSQSGTGMRPSQFGNGQRRAEPAKPRLSYEQVLELAATEDYERRLREEPGFAEQVNEAFAAFEKRNKRAG